MKNLYKNTIESYACIQKIFAVMLLFCEASRSGGQRTKVEERLINYFCLFQNMLYNKTIKVSNVIIINPIQDGLFGGCSRMGGGVFLSPLPKIRRTYATIIKLGKVIPYPRKIKKIYQSRDTSLEFCWHQHFFPWSFFTKSCYINKYTYRLHFDT